MQFGPPTFRVFEDLVERAPVDEAHRQEWASVGQEAEIMDGWDAGMLQLTGNTGFANESTSSGRIDVESVLQHFDCDFAAERPIGGAKDDAHSTPSDLVENLVSVGGPPVRRLRCAVEIPQVPWFAASFVDGELAH